MNSFTWTGNGSSSAASDPNNWVDQSGNPGVPGTGDSVDFPSQSVVFDTITGGLDAASLSIEGLVNYVSGNFDVSGNLSVSTPNLAANFGPYYGLTLAQGATGLVGGDLDVARPAFDPNTGETTFGVLINGANLTVDGNVNLGSLADPNGEIFLQNGAQLQIGGNLNINQEGQSGDNLDIWNSTVTVANGQSVNVEGALYLVGSAAALITNQPINIGDGSFGYFNLQEGASFTTVGDLVLGQGQGGSGLVEVQDGTLNVSGNLMLGLDDGAGGEIKTDAGNDAGTPSIINVLGNVIVGASQNSFSGISLVGYATFDIEAGGSLDLGQAVGSVGSLTLDESTATLESTGAITVGDAGEGEINLAGNGTGVGLVTPGDLALAVQSTATGYLYLGPGSSLTVGGALDVGQHGTAQVWFTGGGSIKSDSAVLGEFTGGAGSAFVDGLGAVWSVSADLQVGDGGTGSLEITDGGTVTSQNGEIGTGTSDAGAVNVDGLGSSWSMSGYLHIGVQGGTGSPSLTVSDQASVTVTSDPSNYDTLLSGTLTLQGGATLTDNYLDMHNAAALTIESGATMNENGSSAIFNGYMSGLGGNGTITIDDGTLSSPNAITLIGLATATGGAGTGTLTASDGATIKSLATYVGEFGGDNGTVTLTGAGTTWTDTGSTAPDANSAGLTVGVAGTGTLTVEDGAVLSNPLSYIKIGQYGGSTGTVTVTGVGSTLSAGGVLSDGNSGRGTLTVEAGGQAELGSVQVGDWASANGELDIDAGGTVSTNSASTVDVGPEAAANGTINVAAGSFDIGVQAGAQGTVNVDGGTLNVDGTLTVGDAGTGTVTASDGATITSLQTSLGGSAGGGGTLTLTGAGTTWTDTSGNSVDSNSAGINVGLNGTGTLTIENGAVLSNPMSYIKIGQNPGATGTATVTGTGSILSAGGLLRVGDSGKGTLTIEAGGQAEAGSAQVGDFFGSIGEIDIDAGGTLTTNSASAIDLGAQLGGTVVAGYFDIGVEAGSQGTVKVEGGTLKVGSDLIVGDAGTGSLTISAGGTVTSQQGGIGSGTGTGTGNDGTVTVDGPGSSWSISHNLQIGVQGGSGNPSLTVSNQASVTAADPGTYNDYLYSGSLTLETGGQFTDFTLDMHNAATLAIESGATLTEAGPSAQPSATEVWEGVIGNGTITIDDATLASPNNFTFIGIQTTTGGAGNGTLTASDGATITSLGVALGYAAGDTGTLTLTGAGTTWTDTGSTVPDDNSAGLVVGQSGTGTLTVEDGAVLSNPFSYIKVGQYGTGTATVTGAGSILSAGGLLRVGDSGRGTLTVEVGGLASAGSVQVGDWASANGEFDIDTGGTVSTNSASTVDVGPEAAANGTINVAAGSFDIGVQAGAQGTVNVDGGTLNVDGTLTDGDAGTGTVTASDGATITSLQTSLGGSAGGGGTLTLTGAGTTWTDTSGNSVDSNSAGINVGLNGTGTLTIENGAVLSNPMSYIKIGQNPGATGTATVTGTGSILSAGGLLRVGDSGKGTLTVEAGGQAEAGSAQVGDFFGSIGEIDIDAGGTLTTNSASAIDLGAQLGGTVVAGYFDIGVEAGSQGTVKVEGGTLNVDGNLIVGDAGSGSLAISAGGKVASQGGVIVTGTGNNGMATVDGLGSSWSMSGFLHIGAFGGTGTASLTVSNQASVTTATSPSSFDELFSGTLTLETGAQLTETSLVTLKATTLTVKSGATLTENGPSPLGLYANGTITIDDATLASQEANTVVGGAAAGDGAGNGTLTASDGATITSLSTYLGQFGGDSGTVILTGSGTTWTDTGSTAPDANSAGLVVGAGGTGTLTVEAGAVLSNPMSYIKIGQFGTGTATVTGANSTLSAGGLLRVGDSAKGTLTVEAGGLASAGTVQVGDWSGANGEIDIDAGGTVSTNSASTVDVGPQAAANGPINVAAGSFDIGVQAGAQGTVNVAGGTLNVDGDLIVGDGGTGGLTVSAGGMASAQSVQVGPAGTITLDVGGTLTAGSEHVDAGGQIVLAGGTNDPPDAITIDAGGRISGYGSIIGNIDNDGTLQATGGTLVVSGALTGTGQITVAAGASLNFGGSVASGQTVALDGTTLMLADPSGFAGTITGLLTGDMIDLTTAGFSAGGSANLEANNVLQIVENGQTYDLQLGPTQSFTGENFQLAADGAGTGTAVTVYSTANSASPGYYQPLGAPAPIIDPPGTYTNEAGATSAILAPAGYYDAGTGNTAAIIDPAGTYTSVAGSTAAILAPAGYYDSGTGNTAPTAAPPGYYDPGTGNTAPILLPVANWAKGVSGSWQVASNWSDDAVPEGLINASLSASGTYTVTDSLSTTVGALQIAANATLAITGGVFASLGGTGTGTNAGTIKIGAATLDLLGPFANAATGTLTAAARATIDLHGGSLSGGQITIAAGAALEATGGPSSPGTIGGGAALTDKGTLLATDDTVLTLADVAITATISKTAGAITGGLIEAFDGSATILIGGATITGGALETQTDGLIETVGGTASTLVNATIVAGTTVDVVDGSTLTISGTIAEAGTLALAAGADATELVVGASGATLTGGGSVTLSNSSDAILGDPIKGGTLTNRGNTISGSGQIGHNGDNELTLNNLAGTIDANISGKTLTIDTGSIPVTNKGLLEATAGGTLLIVNDVANTGGTIESQAAAGSQSTVEIEYHTISGGVVEAVGFVDIVGSSLLGVELETAGGGFFHLDNATIVGGKLTTINNDEILILTGSTSVFDGRASTLVDDANVRLEDGATLELEGAIDNTGTIGPVATGDAVTLDIDGAVTLSGNGSVVLSNNAGDAIVGDLVKGGTLTNRGNTISGSGQIGHNGDDELTLNNLAGTIDADISGKTLTIDTGSIPVTNKGLLEATAGGTLLIVNDVANTGGTIESQAAAGSQSTVEIEYHTISGGVVEAVGFVDIVGSSLLGVELETAGGGFFYLDNATIVGGKLTTINNDEILILTGSTSVFDGRASTLVDDANVRLEDGAALELEGAIDNTGTIGPVATGDAVTLDIDGAVTLSGNGSVVLSNNAGDAIVGDLVKGGTLTNRGNTISGSGQIGHNGDDELTLNNLAGTIDADISGNTLMIDTGNKVTNKGLLEATAGGTLMIDDKVNSAGGVIAADGGNIKLAGMLSGAGAVEIFSGSSVTLGSTATNAVTFENNAVSPLSSLILQDAQGFSGTVAGLASSDSIDLANFLSPDTSITKITGTGAAGTTTNVTLTDADPSNPSNLSVTLHLMNQFSNQFGTSASDYLLASDHTASNGTLFQLAAHV